MSEDQQQNRASQQVIEELIKISSEEKEEKEAKIIELKKEVENKYYGIKKPLIIEAKNALIKEGCPKEKVTSEIVRKLEGYITEAYIRRCIDDPELKDASKVRKQIEVTNTGEQMESTGDENNNARDEWEKNKYYKNMPKITNTTLPNNSQTVGIPQGVQNDAYPNEDQKLIKELKAKIERIESERSQHTTVTIGKELFPELLQYVDDKKVKRIFVDFDDNFNATKIRANL